MTFLQLGVLRKGPLAMDKSEQTGTAKRRKAWQVYLSSELRHSSHWCRKDSKALYERHGVPTWKLSKNSQGMFFTRPQKKSMSFSRPSTFSIDPPQKPTLVVRLWRFFFLLDLRLGICVEVGGRRQNYFLTPPFLPPSSLLMFFLSLPTIISLTQVTVCWNQCPRKAGFGAL